MEKRYTSKEDKEDLELIVTAYLDKFLGNDFYVIRTSKYDSMANNVDILMFQKETGDPVCFFVEVADETGPRFEERRAEILERNFKGGGKVEYGCKVII